MPRLKYRLLQPPYSVMNGKLKMENVKFLQMSCKIFTLSLHATNSSLDGEDAIVWVQRTTIAGGVINKQQASTSSQPSPARRRRLSFSLRDEPPPRICSLLKQAQLRPPPWRGVLFDFSLRDEPSPRTLTTLTTLCVECSILSLRRGERIFPFSTFHFSLEKSRANVLAEKLLHLTSILVSEATSLAYRLLPPPRSRKALLRLGLSEYTYPYSFVVFLVWSNYFLLKRIY